jgi:hypothetical protein
MSLLYGKHGSWRYIYIYNCMTHCCIYSRVDRNHFYCKNNRFVYIRVHSGRATSNKKTLLICAPFPFLAKSIHNLSWMSHQESILLKITPSRNKIFLPITIRWYLLLTQLTYIDAFYTGGHQRRHKTTNCIVQKPCLRNGLNNCEQTWCFTIHSMCSAILYIGIYWKQELIFYFSDYI